jgi:hypothetical protein
MVPAPSMTIMSGPRFGSSAFSAAGFMALGFLAGLARVRAAWRPVWRAWLRAATAFFERGGGHLSILVVETERAGRLLVPPREIRPWR